MNNMSTGVRFGATDRSIQLVFNSPQKDAFVQTHAVNGVIPPDKRKEFLTLGRADTQKGLDEFRAFTKQEGFTPDELEMPNPPMVTVLGISFVNMSKAGFQKLVQKLENLKPVWFKSASDVTDVKIGPAS